MEPVDQEKNNQTSPNLKKQFKSGDVFDNHNSAIWTKENILAGLQKFYEEKGRYPVSYEVDEYEYLPSSKQIQRRFGGLIKLRNELGFEISNFSSGLARSTQATKIGVRGSLAEREVESILINHLGDYFVHVEKPLYKYFKKNLDISKKYKLRADFFIYAVDYKACIDVFFQEMLKLCKELLTLRRKNILGCLFLLSW